MAADAADPPKFTLRFHRPANRELLGLLADRRGISKNQLAEEMLERELKASALLLERDLTGTLDMLRRYRRDRDVRRAIDEVAHAEAYEEDPLATRMTGAGTAQDAYGIAAAFADAGAADALANPTVFADPVS
ncbi:MAG TPA: hypothetical protein VHU13_06910 [Solirubrobacteraceae bacterium]|jgi:hypothetical protein|nr:hypothetical protein [Solirubrobacteraceae bacterium]